MRLEHTAFPVHLTLGSSNSLAESVSLLGVRSVEANPPTPSQALTVGISAQALLDFRTGHSGSHPRPYAEWRKADFTVVRRAPFAKGIVSF